MSYPLSELEQERSASETIPDEEGTEILDHRSGSTRSIRSFRNYPR